MEDWEVEVDRLRRRCARERKARHEAESIAERATRELYETAERLRALNESLTAPVLLIRAGVVVMPLIGIVDSGRFTDNLLRGVRHHRARAAVVDFTGVPAIDETSANGLIQAVEAARLLGTTVIVTGLAPGVAQTFVALGVGSDRLQTANDLMSGVELADRLAERPPAARALREARGPREPGHARRR